MNVKCRLLLFLLSFVVVGTITPMRRTTRLTSFAPTTRLLSNQIVPGMGTNLKTTKPLQTQSINKNLPWLKTFGRRLYGSYGSMRTSLTTALQNSKNYFVGPLIAGTALGTYLHWNQSLKAHQESSTKLPLTLDMLANITSQEIDGIINDIFNDQALRQYYETFCKDHFLKLLEDKNGVEFLTLFIIRGDYWELFADDLIEHIAKVVNHKILVNTLVHFLFDKKVWWGYFIDSRVVKKLVQKIENSFETICQQEYGILFLTSIAFHHSGVRELLSNKLDYVIATALEQKVFFYLSNFARSNKAVFRNFYLRNHSALIINLIDYALQIEDEAIKDFIEVLVEGNSDNAVVLGQYLFSPLFLTTLSSKKIKNNINDVTGCFIPMINNCDAQKIALAFWNEHFLSICHHTFFVDLLNSHSDQSDDVHALIQAYLTHSFGSVISTPYGYGLVDHIQQKEQYWPEELKKKVDQWFIQNYRTITLDQCAWYFYRCSNTAAAGITPLIKNIVEDYLKETRYNSIDALYKARLCSLFFQEYISYSEQDFQSPTVNHIAFYKSEDVTGLTFFLKKYQEDLYLKGLMHKIISLENNLQQTHYTFVHGQRSNYLLGEYLHTFLDSITSHQSLPHDFLHMHVKEKEESVIAEMLVRERLISKGRQIDNDRARLLFANRYLFGNSDNVGSSTALYIIGNDNVGSISIDYEKIFEFHNCSVLYEKYKNKLEELQQQFQSLTKYGTCIMIAIPKDKVHKNVYLAKSGGIKRTLAIEGIGQTDDIRIILEALQNNPEKCDNPDEVEFCITMTQDSDGALNPESGTKVFAFNAADDSALEAWYMQRNELFADLEKDIQTLQAQREKEQAIVA